MKPFQVGERVAVYHAGKRMVGEVVEDFNLPVPGAVAVRIGFSEGYSETGCFHRKQLRRLVKKERRRVWVDLHRLSERDPGVVCFAAFETCVTGCVEFIEVRRK